MRSRRRIGRSRGRNSNLNRGSHIDGRLVSHRRGGGDAQSGTCSLQETLVKEALGLVNGLFHLVCLSSCHRQQPSGRSKREITHNY